MTSYGWFSIEELQKMVDAFPLFPEALERSPAEACNMAEQLIETMQELARLQAENARLSAKIEAALAIEERELSLDDYRRTFNEENRGANDMRAQFRKVLGGKE